MPLRSTTALAALLVIATLISSSPLARQADSPIARREHPRLLMTGRKVRPDVPTVAEVRDKINAHAGLRSRIAEGIGYVDARFATATQQGGQILRELMGNYAFLSQILSVGPIVGASPQHTAPEYGRRAADMAMALLQVLIDGGLDPPYEQEAAYPAFLSPLAYDWAWSAFTPAERARFAAYMKASEVTSWREGSGLFQGSATTMTHYMMLCAAALANEGNRDDAFWQDVLDSFPRRVMPDPTGTIRSWSAHGGFTGGAITEGTSYMGYTHFGGLQAAESYRTAFGLSKTDFYDRATMTQYWAMPRLMASLVMPYSRPARSWPGGRYRWTLRGNYSHTGPEGQNLENQIAHEFANAAGVLGFLDRQMAGLGMWLQNERTTLNHVTGSGFGAGSSAFSGWMIRAVLSDETIAPLSPADAGVSLSEHFATGPHVYRESLTEDGGWMWVLHTPKWSTGAASGRQPSHMAGHRDIQRKGPQVIMRGNVSHQGAPSGFTRPQFPPVVRVRRDAASLRVGGGLADDVGDVRGATIGQLARIADSTHFIVNGVADFLGELRTADADLSQGRDVDYVYADLTKAYYWADHVSNEINPKVVNQMVTEMVGFRGPPGSPLRLISRDRWEIVPDKVGVNEAIFNINLSTPPSVLGGSIGVPGPVRNGSADCHTTYGAADRIEAVNRVGDYDGSTAVTILSPAQREVIRAGGPSPSGRMYYSENGQQDDPRNSCEFMDATGFRFRPVGLPNYRTYTEPDAPEVGQYRIEVRDTSRGGAGQFLFCWEVGDAGISHASCAALGPVSAPVGARWGDRAVVFLEGGQATFQLPAGNQRVLFAGSPGARHTLACGSSSQQMTLSAAGTAYVQLDLAATTSCTAR
jgi:hypothetical protein